MADEHEDFSDAHNAELSDEIAELNVKVNDLEVENKELKTSVEKLSTENLDLTNQVEKAQSENKALGSVAARAAELEGEVAARAAELEGEVARLHHDLASVMSDLQESNGNLSELKRELEVVKGREKENDVKLEAAEREKALLGAEIDTKDKQINDLKKNVEDLAVVVVNGKSSETEKDDWLTKIEKMKVELGALQSSLDEKESVIRELESAVNGGKKGSVGCLSQRDWLVAGCSTIAAVSVTGIVCYLHASRKR